MAADNTLMDNDNWMPEWLVQARPLLYQDFLFAEITKKKQNMKVDSLSINFYFYFQESRVISS